MPDIYLGIDPGASGGLAAIGHDGPVAISMPATERDVWDWIDGNFVRPHHAVIERVGGFVQGNPAPGSAMFRFGQSYGGLRMALIGAGVPFDEVTPQRWQKELGAVKRKAGASKADHKNALKALAQQHFPGVKVTSATADALLLALYCKRLCEGRLGVTR